MARFVTISPEMSEAVIQHLRDNFFADEPLNKAVSLCERGQPHAALEGLCAATMADGLSIAAVEGDTVSGGQVEQPSGSEMAQSICRAAPFFHICSSAAYGSSGTSVLANNTFFPSISAEQIAYNTMK